MSTIFDNHQIEVFVPQLTFNAVNRQVEISLLETRIQILEEENTRLHETLQFFLEIYCCDD